jgi:hypothetical protein
VLYRRLADLVMVIHALVTLFVLGGAFLAMLGLKIAIIHFPLVVWVSTGFIMGWTCPLTPLEKHLRELSGSRGYEGGFIEHYLWRPFFALPNSRKETRKGEIAIGIMTGLLNTLLYAAVFLDLPRTR